MSNLIEQGIITIPGTGDVLVMVFTDVVMYVHGELMDGEYFMFHPKDKLELPLYVIEPVALTPIAEHRPKIRALLMADYANKLVDVN